MDRAPALTTSTEAERPPHKATGDVLSDQLSSSLRRRRAASLRCEPLADGRRDQFSFTPLTSPRALSAARQAWAHLASSGLVDDEGFVSGVLRELGNAS
jgi:hypothetical protein